MEPLESISSILTEVCTGCQNLNQQLSSLSDPEGCVARLESLLECCKNSGFDDISEEQISILLTIADQSPVFTEFLCADPKYSEKLLKSEYLKIQKSVDTFREELLEVLGETYEVHEFKNILRAFRRQETVRIGIKDYMDYGSVMEVCAELSDLAETLIHRAYEIAVKIVPPPAEIPRNRETYEPVIEMSVIAMGKLGGRELNFSSDVDLMFIYSEPPEFEGRQNLLLKLQVYYNKLAQFIINLLAEVTSAGYAYRIDTRLRPDGGQGDVSKSIQASERYYESRGEAWELQALIKSRPIAGNEDLCKNFLKMAGAFAFKKYIDESEINDTLAGISGMREKALKIHRAKQTEWLNLKTGVGGIRDIEFIAQVIQILYGGRYPEITTKGTLETLDRIHQSGLLIEESYLILYQSYILFRKIEHRLQMIGEQQLHSLPKDEKGQNRFARQLGYNSLVEFTSEFEDSRNKVAKIFSDIFKKNPVREGLERILNMEPYSQEIEEDISRYGFKEPKRIYDLLMGAMADPKHPHLTPQVRRLSLKILPRLLDIIKEYPNPDQVLINWEKCISVFPARSGLYRTLISNPELLKNLVIVTGESQYLTDIISDLPDGLDLILDQDYINQPTNKEILHERLDFIKQANPNNMIQNLKRLKLGEELKIGYNFLVGKCGQEKTYRNLSTLAEVILEEAINNEYKVLEDKYWTYNKLEGLKWCVIGMGKLGGRELNFCSDLDWIFLYHIDGDIEIEQDNIPKVQEFFNNLSTGIIKLMGQNKIYQIDDRLRPYGKSSPSATSWESYREYLENKVTLWEIQSLVKARVIAGNLILGENVFNVLDSIRYRGNLESQQILEINEMLDRIVKEKGTKQPLKAGFGGVVTIEFLAQIMQLKSDSPSTKTTGTLEAFRNLDNENCLKGYGKELIEAYQLYLLISSFNRLTLGKAEETIPKNDSLEILRHYLKRLLNMEFESKEKLLEFYEEKRIKIQEIYNELVL